MNRARIGFAALALAAAFATACKSDQGSPVTAHFAVAPLIDNRSWVPVTAADDPLASHRPATIMCGVAGYTVTAAEELDIETGFCNYLMLEQPAMVSAPAGAMMHIALLHFDLNADTPAQAHVAVLVGGAIAWEDTIDIPGPAAVLNEEVPAPVALGPDVPIYFHLHNHGQNGWLLGSIGVEVPG